MAGMDIHRFQFSNRFVEFSIDHDLAVVAKAVGIDFGEELARHAEQQILDHIMGEDEAVANAVCQDALPRMSLDELIEQAAMGKPRHPMLMACHCAPEYFAELFRQINYPPLMPKSAPMPTPPRHGEFILYRIPMFVGAKFYVELGRRLFQMIERTYPRPNPVRQGYTLVLREEPDTQGLWKIGRHYAKLHDIAALLVMSDDTARVIKGAACATETAGAEKATERLK